MALGTFALAGLAGLLSVLSPCVLPLLPIVLGAAAAQHRYAPAALAAGVVLSFVTIGLFVASVGFSIGLAGEQVRVAAAVLMIGFGIVLAMPALQARVAAAGAPIGNWADQHLSGMSRIGIAGQFAVGLLLGAIWSPCVGPTLGAASVLAAQGQNLGQVGATMALFGLGAAIPLLLLGTLSRQAMLRWRDRLMRGGGATKRLLGLMLMAMGVLIVSGADKMLETALTNASPQWLVNLTTRF